ncbi:MAG: YfiT family bacillithiol transferase [Bacteroidota bacterium]
MSIEELKYPIGEYHPDKNPDQQTLELWISEIESFPSRLNQEVENLGLEALNWRYRPEGWTIKQVVHHCADSHLNSIMRFKLALTEDAPIIRPYDEASWAELEDGQYDDLTVSLKFIKALHAKWVKLLKTLNKEDLNRVFLHPEHGAIFNLAETIGNYAWHGNHHLAHIRNALKYQGKFPK